MTSTQISLASQTRLGAIVRIALACSFALVLASASASPARAAEEATKPTPAFRAAMKRFLVAQNVPAQMVEQVSLSAADQVLSGLAASGVAVTEPMQSLVVDLARKQIGSRYGDVESLTDLYSRIYAVHFTEAEVGELASFWESPVGRKLLAKTAPINERFVADVEAFLGARLPGFQAEAEKQLRAAGMLGTPGR